MRTPSTIRLRRLSRFPIAALLAAVSLGTAACASTGSGSGSSGGSVLTHDQLVESNEPNLYNAIQRLRPTWLRPRGSQVSGAQVALFVDGAPRGTVSQLSSIPIENVVEVQFYTASEAGFTFGTVGGNAGVVEVRTR